MLAALFPIIGAIGQRVANSLFPDPADALKRDQVAAEISRAAMDHAAAIEQAAAENVRTELASGSWLGKNWRPLSMLFFLTLIGARWFGFTPDGMTEAEILELWTIVKIGLGGYVGGRTVEKIVPAIAGAIKAR